MATVPLLHLRSAIRRHQQTYVPLIAKKDGYEQTADRIAAVLTADGFAVSRRRPTFWMRAPHQIMRTLGGDALAAYAPDQLAYLVGRDLEVVLYPSSLLIRGAPVRATISQGLILEALAPTDAYQTMDADAQDLEKQIHRVWAALEREPRAHVESPWLEQRLAEITSRLRQLEAPYDEWQIVYRQVLQLGRALHGEPQLLTGTEIEEEAMNRFEHTGSVADAAAEQLSTPELVREIGAKAMELVAKEIDLAKAEIREDYRAELSAIKAFAAAIVAGIGDPESPAPRGSLRAREHIPRPYARRSTRPGWCPAVDHRRSECCAKRKHVEEPLDATRKTVEEDVQWAKQQMA